LPRISPCAKAAWISLCRAWIWQKRLENGEDYLLINPKGQVPALLLDDDILLTEGVAIMQYIADQVPDRHLLAPVGSVARYQTLEWLNYVATELHKGFTPLFRPDTPEDYKPVARALLEKNCSTLMPRWRINSG
jgi:glutathione S-transferase